MNAPNARTISELRRLAFCTKAECTDIAHKDDCNPVSFVEYAYAAKTTQPDVPRGFQEAMKVSDADLWREAAEKKIKSLSMSTGSFPGQQFLQAKRSLAPSRFLR